ncbi:glucosidase family protein [Spiractinospora alimapuensis]|uniref:prenyltransferase n=1 Tax=Spiractinospora alimapuensis TaxID=2820884 RepID=UPI001F1C48AC|nr:prenyltransferase [Spiractinospora alimapuensis]
MPHVELPELPGVLGADAVAATAEYIRHSQRPSGAIPWYPGGHVDAWDHVECAMALTVAGHRVEAERAYRWLAAAQRPDGSWPARIPAEEKASHAEAHHAAYLAVGLWHHYLVTGDVDLVRHLWPHARSGVEFALGLRTDRGDVLWARAPDGAPGDHSLVTGCASVYHGLRCGVALAELLDRPQVEWEIAAAQLRHVVVEHEGTFADRRRFSMDWYYPILGGVLDGRAARERVTERWDTFVVPGLGIRCVSDQPWVTGAETCELVLALAAVGEVGPATQLFADMQHLRDPQDGAYWTGYQFAHDVRWPTERSTWTSASVVLAADALSSTTPGTGAFGALAAPAPATDAAGCGCASHQADAHPRG